MSQEETLLRKRIVNSADAFGFWGSNVNDRFESGKPDMRFSNELTGQLDIELKILRCQPSTWERNMEVASGLSKLQEIELREMNKHGAPAVGVILVKCVGLFIFSNYQKVDLLRAKAFGTVPYREKPLKSPCVDLEELVYMGRKYLRSLR